MLITIFDFTSMREPYQKVVKISPLDGKFMATGGEDGILRIWTFPDLNQVKDLEEHDKEIDDIEFSPDQTKVEFISNWNFGASNSSPKYNVIELKGYVIPYFRLFQFLKIAVH